MHYKITYLCAYHKGQLTPHFESPDAAVAYLDRLYSVIYWDEDDDHPDCYDVAVRKGYTPVYSIEPIITE